MGRSNNHPIGKQSTKGNKPNRTLFKKGNIPWSKGKKGIHFSPATEFKKGQKGTNWLPMGTKKIRKENKTNTLRKWIKIAEPSGWIEYSKFIWIKHNGQIPKGFLIHHIDKDALNNKIENLSLLTRKGHINIHRVDLLKAKQNKRVI